MKTPMFEAGWSKFTSVQKSAEYRGRVEAYQNVLEWISKVDKPTVQLKQLAKSIQAELEAKA
jgi:hypothetical protein